MGIVVGGNRICQRVSASRLSVERNGFAFSSRIISAAPSDILAEIVNDTDPSCTLGAQLGDGRSCQFEESIRIAPETTNRLASATL